MTRRKILQIRNRSQRPSRWSGTRRELLKETAGMAMLLAASSTSAENPGRFKIEKRVSCNLAAPNIQERVKVSYQLRVKAARRNLNLPRADQLCNGDETELPKRIACFSKGLPHNDHAEVDGSSYDTLLRALKSGKPYDFERIPLGGYVKLANPQAAFAYSLIGPDCCQLAIPPAPKFSSDRICAELIELYWQALTRDIPFSDYDNNSLILEAVRDLSRFSNFRGLNPHALFRGETSGDLTGPYVSQFLWRDIPLSPIRATQKIRTAVADVNYLTKYEDWLAIQNGSIAGVNQFDQQPRYIRNGRDLGEYVHRDFTYQAFICAALSFSIWGLHLMVLILISIRARRGVLSRLGRRLCLI